MMGRHLPAVACGHAPRLSMQALRVATQPLLLSHAAILGLRATGRTPLKAQQVSADHARAIAETGGAVGIWHFFPSLDRYVEGLKEMADIVGVYHVSIGTDQHVTPGSLPDYNANGCTSSRRCCAAASLPRRLVRLPAPTMRASFGLRWVCRGVHRAMYFNFTAPLG